MLHRIQYMISRRTCQKHKTRLKNHQSTKRSTTEQINHAELLLRIFDLKHVALGVLHQVQQIVLAPEHALVDHTQTARLLIDALRE